MKAVLLTLAALAVLPQQAVAAKLSAADKAWIGTCAGRLAADEKKAPKAARIYCTCMHEQVENNEAMSQTELERSWPPIHIACRREAGWHKERHR